MATLSVVLLAGPELPPESPPPPIGVTEGSDTPSRPAPEPESPPERGAQQKEGRGMLIAAGVLGSAALALRSAHAHTFYTGCDSFHYDDGCFGGFHPEVSTLIFGPPAFALSATGLALAVVGSRRRGRAHHPITVRSAHRSVVSGSALLAVGIAVRIVSFAFMVRAAAADPDAIYEGNPDGETLRALYTAGVVGAQVGDTLGATGAGLIAYGRAGSSGPRVEVGFAPGGLRIRF